MNPRNVNPRGPESGQPDAAGRLHGATEAPESEEEHRARTESLGEMFSRLSKDLSTLFRQEVQLAKAEATQSAKQAGAGIGMLVGAAIGALLLLIFLSTSLMWL